MIKILLNSPGIFMTIDINLIYNVERYTNYPCRNVVYLNESRVLTFEIFNMINDAVRKRVEGTNDQSHVYLQVA